MFDFVKGAAPWFVASVVLCACGGGGSKSGNPAPPSSYTVGGTITGLGSADGLVLSHGSDTLKVAGGMSTFTMPMAITGGSLYSITVQGSPVGLNCQVQHGFGTAATENVTNIIVTCSTATYTVGGTVSGLIASGLVLANGTDTVSIESGATSFTMPNSVAYGGSYAVTIKTQPAGETCAVFDGADSVCAGAVTTIELACSPAASAEFLGGPSYGNLPSSGTIAVTLNFDPGGYFPNGQSFSYTPQNATLRANGEGKWFAITIDGVDTWSGWMQTPSGQAHFQPGSYPNMWQLSGASSWGSFNWSGHDMTFTSGTTNITINSVTYVGDVMTDIDFNFDQTSVTNVGNLHGHVTWSAAGTTASVAPMNTAHAVLWRAATKAESKTGNYVYLESDTADWVGQGQTNKETPQNTQQNDSTVAGGGVQIRAQGVDDSFGQFQVMSGQTQLQPGYYGQVERWQMGNPARGGLTWDMDSRGCNRSMGWFAVDSVSYTDGAITALDMRFVQHCEIQSYALRGQIHWRANDTTVAAGPTTPPPGLWQPAAGATPASGNYVYLYSEAHEYVVAGPGGPTTEYLYTSNITVTPPGSAPGPNLTVNVDGVTGWFGEFAGMYSLTQFQPVYYGPLVSTDNPAAVMVNRYGMGRGCDYTSVWVVIDNVSYVGNTMTSIALRFKQLCQGFAPALYGKIHWVGR